MSYPVRVLVCLAMGFCIGASPWVYRSLRTLRPLRALREAFRRRPPTVQVDLAFATTDELLDELTARSRAAVIVVCTLAKPDDIRARYGGRGDNGNGARVCELLGLIDYGRCSLREMTRKGDKA